VYQLDSGASLKLFAAFSDALKSHQKRAKHAGTPKNTLKKQLNIFCAHTKNSLRAVNTARKEGHRGSRVETRRVAKATGYGVSSAA
jgi:hypothetical protein